MAKQEDKDILQAYVPNLKDLVWETAFAYRRAIPGQAVMIDISSFLEEASRMREMAKTTGTVANIALIEHATKKFMLGNAKPLSNGAFFAKIPIAINMLHMSSPRIFRQDRSVGLILAAADSLDKTMPVVAKLLLRELDPLSPAAVMSITPDGNHFFFRGLNTTDQTEQENERVSRMAQFFPPEIFIRGNDLHHFFAPVGQQIATPVLL